VSAVKPPVVFLMGPTASGKSDLAVALAERLDAEIVSVDSAMVYRGLDIGTAKPDPATRERVPHALIDIREPWRDYSVAEFVTDARFEIERIRAAGRPAILVGGSSLYYRALESGLSALPARDPLVRAEIQAEAGRLGWPALHARLAEIDALRARQIHPNDRQRVERALEIVRVTGRPPSTQLDASKQAGCGIIPSIKLVIAPADRAELHRRIDLRLSRMLNVGLLTEVEKLTENPKITRSNAAMTSVGYRQLRPVALGRTPIDDGIEHVKAATRQLAKRQLTWLRQQDDAYWMESGAADICERSLSIIEHFRDSNVR
jgi:tRNA dimethylallyltransferase